MVALPVCSSVAVAHVLSASYSETDTTALSPLIALCNVRVGAPCALWSLGYLYPAGAPPAGANRARKTSSPSPVKDEPYPLTHELQPSRLGGAECRPVFATDVVTGWYQNLASRLVLPALKSCVFVKYLVQFCFVFYT